VPPQVETTVSGVVDTATGAADDVVNAVTAALPPPAIPPLPSTPDAAGPLGRR
jgi:hypothetical protein